MIGFFGGTFDPPHFGHLHLADSLIKKKNLKEVWFCPVATSPFKGDRAISSAQDRLAMCRLAIEEMPKCRVIDLEILRGGISYTSDTIRALKALHPEEQFCLILGEDQLSDLPKWKEWENLCKEAPPLIGRRPGFPHETGSIELFEVIDIPPYPLSSTAIRERIEEKKSCDGLVPPKVLDYIFSHQLYL